MIEIKEKRKYYINAFNYNKLLKCLFIACNSEKKKLRPLYPFIRKKVTSIRRN